MQPHTAKLWAKQNAHEGDRKRLFTAVREHVGDGRVLYPGSYVDVAASCVFSDVVYVDMDRRANRFFEDVDGVREIIDAEGGPPAAQFEFIHSDYTADLGLEPASFDLLVSLYAGFISEACGDLLRVGGTLLVNPSHGDVAMASIDERFELSGVVTHRSGTYRARTEDLDSYLIPKKSIDLTVEFLHDHGRAIAYTKSVFAYLFTRVA